MAQPQVRQRSVIVKEFNDTVTAMLKNVMLKHPEDYELEKIRSKLAHAKTTSETILITHAGTFLLKYEKEITAGDEKALFSEQLEKEAAESPEGQFALSMLVKLRKYYSEFKPAEKRDMVKKMNMLLNDYLEFRLAKA